MSLTIASYGGGTNSTAMLIECAKRGITVDLILFADTGGERPHTYQYIRTFNKWLVKNGMPIITRVQRSNINGTAITLESYCLQKRQLPSLAYGFKTCSQKHKIQPQDKFVNNWQPAKDEWKAGRKITKLVGYDADEPQRAKDYTDDKYTLSYPLIHWDMGRDECIETIKDAGLCLPGKSACFFCPSTKKHEILELQQFYPELMDRALLMEQIAAEQNQTVKGLGRRFSWREVIEQQDAFGYDLPPEMACGCYDG